MIVVNPYACPQNHPCPSVRTCPVGAIVQDNSHSAPRIDQDLCTECGACTQSCRAFTHVKEEALVH